MNRESVSFESQEKSKAVSIEKTEDGSLAIGLSSELKKKEGMIFTVAAIVESIVKEGLFEVIVNVENGSLEVQSLNPTQEVPEDIKAQIVEALAKLDTVF